MSKRGTYIGGSTIIRTFVQKPSPAKKKTGALDEWIESGRQDASAMPEDIRLKPIQRFAKASNGKKGAQKKKKRKGKTKGQFGSLKRKRHIDHRNDVSKNKVDVSLENIADPEVLELIYARREQRQNEKKFKKMGIVQEKNED